MERNDSNSSREEYLKYLKPGTAAQHHPIEGERPRSDPSRLTDAELEARLGKLVSAECEATADVVEHIAIFEDRMLFAERGFSSMFEYCTKKLGYSEGAAYLRIYAGRLSLKYPDIVRLLRSRRLHLTAIRTVGPLLTPTEGASLLSQASGKTERELKFIVAAKSPKPDLADVVRRLGVPKSPIAATASNRADPIPASAAAPEIQKASFDGKSSVPEPSPFTPSSPKPSPPSSPKPSPPARIEPLSAERVRFAFTGSERLMRKVDRAREILRHVCPSGELEVVFERALDAFLDEKDPARKRPARPRAAGARRRAVAQWIKDAVHRRDGGRCVFRSAEGERCEERGGLEYDHVVAWARGGRSNDPSNIRLLCRAHNALAARRDFGLEFIARKRRNLKRN